MLLEVRKVSFMKRNLLFVLLLLVTSFGFAQNSINSAKPTSKIINAEQLLNDLKTLSADDMEGRGTGTKGISKAREYIVNRFKESGLEPLDDTYFQDFEIVSRQPTEKLKGINVLGFIKGKKNPENFIVITAHYDHLGIKNGEIYNGADDNASGTCALFAIAKYFVKNQPSNSLVFVAFDAEEMGLQGSKYFVRTLPVLKESILLNINMDMISHNDKNELYATGTFSYPKLKPFLETVQKTAPVKLLLGHDDPKLGHDNWTDQSDQGSFYKVNIPFIYFGVEDHKDYHKSTDDFPTINQPFYVHTVETIVVATELFDKNLK